MLFRRTLIATALSALVLAACSGTDGTDDAAQQADQTPDELGELDGDLDLDEMEGELDLDDLLGEQGELPDPNEHVENGVFRGDGIVLPIPEGFELEPTAYMQGLVAAVTPDGERQVAGQAVDAAALPDPLDLDELAEANQEQLGEATSDEETEVDGATRARALRFDDVPGQMEGQPDLSLLLILAEDGEGEIAIFNYVAPADEFDGDEAEARLAGVGFDPDSSPPDPEPAPAPAP